MAVTVKGNSSPESAGKGAFRCVFISDWICPIEASEIPLEVCRLCLDARWAHANEKRIERTVMRPPKPISEEGKLSDILSLDRHFMNGDLSIEKYLRKRKEAIISLQKEKKY
ncbi:MAG: hypothetical protein ACTSXC_07115 [Candidatus Freyarchaeota archaeon]